MRCYPASQAEGDHEWHRDDSPDSLEVSNSDKKVPGCFLLIVIAAWGRAIAP